MQDRIPTYAGRVKLTPVTGQTDTYDLTRADEPMQIGTPLNKATLLTDETATALGLAQGDPTVNDALAALKSFIEENATAIANGTKIATGSYTGTGTYGSSNKNTITFNFKPKLVIINGQVGMSGYAGTTIMVRGYNYGSCFFGSSNTYNNSNAGSCNPTLVWGEKDIAFYSTVDEYTQLNYNGRKYSYVAIG